VLWYAVHEPYGGPDALVRFVDACHARGLGVLIDAVFNHLGPSGNYLPRFGPYLSSGSNPWGEGLNLSDPDSDEVRRFIIDGALRWMRDFHADGLRLDAVHALVDTTAIHILEELSAETDALAQQLGRPLSLIAESDLNDPRLITPRDRGGYGMTAQWDDDIHHAIHAAVSGERQGYYADFGTLETLATTLQNGYFHAGTYSSFRGRRHGRPLDKTTTPATRLIAYTSTRWRSPPPTPQCFSWARNGVRHARFSSSPAIPNPSWPGRPPRDARRSSPSTAGTPTQYPIRKTRRRFRGPSSTGMNSVQASTHAYETCTGG
jgi:maltooligosyltrehalose trehalohydrolase